MADDDGHDFVGKVVLIGFTHLTHDDVFISQEQFWGEIVECHPTQGITVRLMGDREGQYYRLPPDTDLLHVAEPGEYRLRSTGEVVIDPDYVTTWTLHKPAPTH